MSPIPSESENLRLIAYIRVSTKGQADEGVSLSLQREKIEAYAGLMDHEVIMWVQDKGKSAKSLDRPGLQRALKALREGKADGIVTYKLDRLTRSVRDLGTLLGDYFEDDHALVSVMDQIDTRTATGRLILNVLMSVAQWERETISERTKEALHEVKRQGGTIGRAPYGYMFSDEDDVDEHGRRYLLEDPDTYSVLTSMKALRAKGLSYAAIARQLAAEDAPTPQGGQWRPQTVSRILSR